MKTNFLTVRFLVAITSVVTLTMPSFSYSAQNNFQIAPPPIAYPSFEEGKGDFKIEPTVISIEAPNVTLSGGGINFDGRKAFSGMMATDVQGGIFTLSGQMPGIPPITPIPAYSSNRTFLGYWTPLTTGNANVSMTAMQMSANFEFQPIHGDAGGLIIFGGPGFGWSQLTMKTPYQLYWAATKTYNSGYTDTLTISAITGGLQLGIQGEVLLPNDFRISPFFMVSSYSGSATLKDDPGVSGVTGYSTSADIPSYSTSSIGMDIIVGNLSIGTVLQQMQSQQNQSNSNIKITMFRLGYRF